MVPSGWNIESLGSVTNKVGSGVTPRGGSNSYKSSGIPLIRSQNILWGKLDLSDVAYIDDKQHNKMKGSFVYKDDVLLNITGASIGRVAVSNIDEANVNQHVCIIRSDKLDSGYLKSFLLSFEGQKQVEQCQAGGNRQGLNFEQIKSFKIPFPPLPEQQKIAKILSTWDKAISTTERLIDNSTQQKKALMQQLLTGKKRLLDESGKRFEGEWEELKLENVFKLSSGDTKPKDVENEPTEEQKIPVFGGNNIMGYSANGNSEGDVILIGRVGEYCGVTRLIQEKCWITDNALFTKEFSDEFDRLFIVYLLQNFQLSRLRNKGGQPQISQKPIYNLKLKIPLLKEQQKIATVLTTADKEIELLEQQLADLQQEKKALMQVLLTGKKRVVVDENV